MDIITELAKESAKRFSEWISENKWRRVEFTPKGKYSTPEKRWAKSFWHTYNKTLTTEQLVDKFFEEEKQRILALSAVTPNNTKPNSH